VETMPSLGQSHRRTYLIVRERGTPIYKY